MMGFFGTAGGLTAWVLITGQPLLDSSSFLKGPSLSFIHYKVGLIIMLLLGGVNELMEVKL